MSSAKPQVEQVAVRYIGKLKPYWKDRKYGSGLDFETGQVRVVPSTVAKAFLRHGDLFERADDAPAEAVAAPDDDTATLLAEAQQKRDAKAKEDQQRFDLMDQVERMDKDGLAQFAQDRFSIQLDRRRTVDALRSEVRGLIDQFGPR
jgi:hypothetical protein